LANPLFLTDMTPRQSVPATWHFPNNALIAGDILKCKIARFPSGSE
jgi:hypothetical protein